MDTGILFAKLICCIVVFYFYSNYVLSWLSAVGPVVHLNIPITYAQEMNKRHSDK